MDYFIAGVLATLIVGFIVYKVREARERRKIRNLTVPLGGSRPIHGSPRPDPKKP